MTGQCGPVVIGGIGGSGTRVIAEILSLLGYYLGNDLNVPKDFLLYTLLFKRKNWYVKNRANETALHTGFHIMQKAVISKESLSLRETIYLLNAIISISMHGHNHLGDGKGVWPFIRAKKMFFENKNDLSLYKGWGWKEPNSHLLISEMDQCFSKFKYIHTVRHGLDMAFSENQQQLYNWGPLFGVELPTTRQDVPRASFQYWVKANREAIEKGEKLGPEKFLLINYDQLCIDPQHEILKLFSFLEIDPDDSVFMKCAALPKVATSTGRFQNYHLDAFEHSDLAFLKSLGFTI
jgi:hypothetical protein